MSAVHGEVSAEFVRSGESLGAVGPGANMGLFTGVGAHVGFEVIRSGELALADVALERTDTRVLAAVSPELVRTRETLATAIVLTDIGLFTGVLPNVHLEVRELEVTLGAARVETDEWLPLLISLGVVSWSSDEGTIWVAGWWWKNKGWLGSER